MAHEMNSLENDPKVSNVRVGDEPESEDMAVAQAALERILGDIPFFLMVIKPDGTGHGSDIETFTNGDTKAVGHMLSLIGPSMMGGLGEG